MNLNQSYKIDLSLLATSPTEEIKISTLPIKVILLSALIILFLHTALLQLSESKTAIIEAKTSSRIVQQEAPPRGIFYDRNQVKLVSNITAYELSFLSGVNGDDVGQITSRIKEILNLQELKIKDLDANKFDFYFNNDQRVLIITNLDANLLRKISFTPTDQRYYYYPYELAHVLGYTSGVTKADVDAGYKLSDKVGRVGLEQKYQDMLKGVTVNDYKQKFDVIDNNLLPGDSVILTLDAKWQSQLYKILAAESERIHALGSAAVIMNADNGQVIASVDYPTFDANKFTVGIGNDEYSKLLNDPRNPLLDKVVGLQASPGSAFKLFTTYSLLENNIITTKEKFFSNGCMKLGQSGRFCEIDRRYLGSVNLTEAIFESSNIYFCQAALKLQQKIGIDAWAKDVSLFGFGKTTGSELSGEVSGRIPNTDYKKSVLHEPWFDGDTCNSAIGQGMVTVTPLQLATAASALINSGKLYTPQLVKEIRDYTGNVVQQISPHMQQISLHDSTFQTIWNAMHDVVYDRRGSAYLLSTLPTSLNLHAKTGSVEASEQINGKLVKGTHAWVVVSFTVNNNRYVMVVMHRYGGRSFNALPTVKQFLLAINNS